MPGTTTEVAKRRRAHRAWTGLHGAWKIYHQLRCEGGVDGVPVAHCTVEA